MGRSRGFTLVEITAVVILMGLLAGAVSWSVAGRSVAATLDDAVGQLVFADQLARRTARGQGRVIALHFDLDEGSVRRVGTPGDELDSDETTYARLPKGYAIQSLSTADNTHEGGEVEVMIGPDGRSDSYALVVRAPQGQTRGVLFAGPTGQAVALDDPDRIDAVFALERSGVEDGTANP